MTRPSHAARHLVCPIDHLETRRHFDAGPLVVAELRADANRDGSVTSADNRGEATWTAGRSGRGALVLPNFDKDNTTTIAPDAWTGGLWNGRPAAPNAVIDNDADLRDLATLRMRKLGVPDNAYDYNVTLTLLKPDTDPTWFATTPAADRVRLFFPTGVRGNDRFAQAGDAAVMGPGIGDTIRFVNNPAAANEYDIVLLTGDGWLDFAVEGLKTGAEVRFRVTTNYDPLMITIDDEDGVPAPTTGTDEVAIRVAPFTLADARTRADRVIVEDMNRYGLDNAAAREQLGKVFGDKLITSRSGDLWQQDGYEIGYVQAPYGQMTVVLEFPRSRDVYFDQTSSMRAFVRTSLLAAGVGVSTELSPLANNSGSAYGGDIESLPRPDGAPGYLLASGMPTPLKSFFAAQNVNPMLELNVDDWLGVGHVDEIVQPTASGEKVLIADPDLAWALFLWAAKIAPSARMHAGMNGNEELPGYRADGMKVGSIVGNATLRRQNIEFAQASNRLRGAYNTIKTTLSLSDETTVPAAANTNAGNGALARGGAFVKLLGAKRRHFEVRFIDGDRYQLRYRDAGKTARSVWVEGRRSRDEVFVDARAFILKDYWTGTPQAGDTFNFSTNPAATLIKMPVLFASAGLFFEDPAFPSGPGDWRLTPFTTNAVNGVVDGSTVMAGNQYGPRVKWNGRTKNDLFELYANAAFRGAGYTQVVFTDTRLYHNSSGDLHCGTNVMRFIPDAKWWNA